MSTTSAPIAAVGDRYWVFVLARAIPAAFVAIYITFSADHSVIVGWIALAVFGFLTGIPLVVAANRAVPRSVRGELLAQGAILTVAGVVSAVSATQAHSVQLLVITLAAVFLLSGAAELIAGLRSRAAVSFARDWIFLGGISVAFALAVIFIPTDLSQAITVPGKEVPNLTASVVVVGTLGAYAAIVAVYLVIAGLSLKWAKHPEAVVGTEGAS